MVTNNDELLNFAHKMLRAKNWEQSNLLQKTDLAPEKRTS